MGIIVVDDGNQITVTSEEIQAIVEGLEHTVSTTETTQAIPNNSVEQVVVTDSPEQMFIDESGFEIVVQTVSDTIVKDLYLVNHSSTYGLANDDHPQYHNDARGDLRYTPISHIVDGNPHNTQANEIPGISNWGLRVTAADQAFIEANMGPDAIPSTRIASLVAGKIAAGIMAAKVSLADIFTASANGSTLNDDESGLALGSSRIQMGFIDDALGTYMLRHSNGYADNHPSYVSNFSVDDNGNVSIAGDLKILAGSGIANLTDAGALATRDITVFYQATAPLNPITGDLWYDTDNGNEAARYNGVTWDSVKDSDVLIAQSTADGKINTYFQSTAPTGLTSADNGDLWFDDNMHARYWDDPVWVDAQDSQIAQAIAEVATAQATADGKITTYTGTAYPTTVEGIGDLFYNTSTKVQYRALVAPSPTSGDWEVVGNGFDETGLLTDTANLGGTAAWDGVSGTGKPEDNADVTDVGGANYVIRGLTSPNSNSGSLTVVNEGLANWGFTMPSSAASTQLMNFDLPPLQINTNYVCSFWARSTIADADFRLDLYPDTLPEFLVTVPTTDTKFEFVFNSANANMATAALRFFKLTSSTNPTAAVTVYDVKFEKGKQATDWTPYNPIVDGADDTKKTMDATVIVDSGGIVLNGTAAIHTYLKDAYGDVTGGVYLGWDVTEAAYVLDVGDASNYVRWDGVSLDIAGTVNIGAGSTGYANITGIPTSLSDVNAAEGTKLTGIADNADVTDYTDYRVSNGITDNNVLTIARPVGASLSINANNQDGAIKITLPQSWTSTMMKMVVDVFQYAAGASFSIALGGYNYSTSTNWNQEFAQIFGNLTANNTVRFGHDGTKCCIVIGDETDIGIWDYPKISVRDFQAGYSNFALSQWDDGWNVSLITSTAGITFTGTISDALLDAAAILGQGALATQDSLAYSALTGTKPPSNADVTSDEIEATVSITSGGVVFGDGITDGGGIRSYYKSSFADTDAGFFLGWDTVGGSAYKFNIGDVNNSLQWDGTALTVTGNITGSAITGTTMEASSIKGSTVYGNGTLTTSVTAAGATTIDVGDTTDFTASGKAVIVPGDGVSRDEFNYTGKTATTLTGITNRSFTSLPSGTYIAQGEGIALLQDRNELVVTRLNGSYNDIIASIGLSNHDGDEVIAQFGGTFGNLLTGIIPLKVLGNEIEAAWLQGNPGTGKSVVTIKNDQTTSQGCALQLWPTAYTPKPTHTGIAGGFWVSNSGTLYYSQGNEIAPKPEWRAVAMEATQLAPHAWLEFSMVGTAAMHASYGISAFLDSGTGKPTITFSANFIDINYVFIGQTTSNSTGTGSTHVMEMDNDSLLKTVSQIRLETNWTSAGTSRAAVDNVHNSAVFFGV